LVVSASAHAQPVALVQDHVKVGMLTFLASEVAFFSTLIMTYVFFLRQAVGSSPSPAEVFKMPMVIAATVCLLSSSLTIHLAEGALRSGSRGLFIALWGLTIALGLCFLVGTVLEWTDLIVHWRLTISRNMFGTTYFTLVGFHAGHVTMGLIILSTVLALVLRRHITGPHSSAVTAVSWYWHFVDAVWVVVFTLVYVVGR
jgi:cytochrome c oxidase subunit 3/cytochrome o ubiquinol oxidase subunit 3